MLIGAALFFDGCSNCSGLACGFFGGLWGDFEILALQIHMHDAVCQSLRLTTTTKGMLYAYYRLGNAFVQFKFPHGFCRFLSFMSIVCWEQVLTVSL